MFSVFKRENGMLTSNRIFSCAVAALTTGMLAMPVWAQAPSGQSSLSGSMSQSNSAFSSTSSSSSQSSQSSSNSNTGVPTSGTDNLGSSGNLADQLGTGFIGQSQNSSFIGGNQAAQGTQTATGGGQQQQPGQPGQGGLNNRNGQGGRVSQSQYQQYQQGFNNFQQPGMGISGASALPYRAPHRIAFNAPTRPSANVSLRLGRITTSINNRRPEFAQVRYQIAPDNTVTLTGSVATANDRKLAQLFAQMEPGVRNVVNNLSVTPPSGGGQSLSGGQ